MLAQTNALNVALYYATCLSNGSFRCQMLRMSSCLSWQRCFRGTEKKQIIKHRHKPYNNKSPAHAVMELKVTVEYLIDSKILNYICSYNSLLQLHSLLAILAAPLGSLVRYNLEQFQMC